MGCIMNRKRVTSCTGFLLISALPLSGVALAQEPQPPSRSQRTAAQKTPDLEQGEVRTFAGKISKSGGKYVLEDPSAKTSFSLDDQRKAKLFEGKSVVVTGSLDSSTNTIHVQKIDAVA
jgi:hypothetical protein